MSCNLVIFFGFVISFYAYVMLTHDNKFSAGDFIRSNLLEGTNNVMNLISYWPGYKNNKIAI